MPTKSKAARRSAKSRKPAARRRHGKVARKASRREGNGGGIGHDIIARVTAALNGEPDLLDVLKQEHREVAGMFDKILDTDAPAKRIALLKQIKAALLPHLHGEEEVFYPLLKALGDAEVETDAIEGFVEHHIAENLLEDLLQTRDGGGPEWTARCKVLKELVAHHVEEEESAIWKDARETLGEEKLQQLLDSYEKAKLRYRPAA